MATELDIFGIKEKIEALLEAQATLYDVSDKTKLMDIETGMPDWDGMPRQIPGAYITNNALSETIEVESKVTTSLKHTLRFDIVVVVTGITARDAEEKLDDFVKIIKQELEGDDTLTGSLDMSYPERVQRWTKLKDGNPLAGAVITLKGIATTS